MHRALPTLLALALLGGGACVPGQDVEPWLCENPDPAFAELGAGDLETGFQELDDGSDIGIVLGPQGLHMIVVSVRLEGFEMPTVGGGATPIQVAIRTGDTLVGGAVEELAPSTEDPAMDRVEFLGLRAIFSVADIIALGDVLAEVDASIQDGCGREIRTSANLKLTL